MRVNCVLILTLFLISSTSVAIDSTPVFRFTVTHEPVSLDKAKMGTSESGYLISTLYAPLLKYESGKVIPWAATKCEEKGLTYICYLNPKVKWSNGDKVLAQDYVNAFRKLIDPKSASKDAGLLLTLKNAHAILKKEKPVDSLGIMATNDTTLKFELSAKDPDLSYKLTSSLLSPTKGDVQLKDPSLLLTNGPYRIKQWVNKQRLVLEPNPFFEIGHPARPLVEVLFIDEDSTILKLFEKGDVNFVKRVTSVETLKYKTHPGFFQVPVARGDMIGFGPALLPYPDLRKALLIGINYPEFLKAFDSISRPGCPSFSEEYLEKSVCYDYNLEEAKKLVNQLPPEIRNKKWIFAFSKLGGDDIQRMAEWIQAQWKKNLGIEVELSARENGVHVAALKDSPPDIFRKGIALERPTCIAALEIFERDNPENYIRYQNTKYEKALQKLVEAKTRKEQLKYCSQAYQVLLDDYRLMPLGRFYFNMLRDQKFAGWSLNEMNQLDLSQLHPNTVSK